MQNLRRRLAALLAAVMLISTLPVNALAADPDTGEEISNVGQTDIRDKPDDMEASDSVTELADEGVSRDEVLPADKTALDPQIPENTAADGKVTVLLNGGDEQLVELSADGSYVIDLGNDPFFPYEAALLSEDGEVYPITFEDADSSVSAGDYVFTAAYTGTAQKIGFWVGGTYVPAYPETTAAYSLLPLKYKNFRVDMRNLVGSELQNVKLEAILTNPNKPEDGSGYSKGTSVVWGLQNGQDRFTIAQKDTIDLSSYLQSNSVSLELIVGTPDQLDPDNIRYMVTVELSNPARMLTLTASAGGKTQTQTGSPNSSLTSEDRSRIPYYNFSQYSSISFWDKDDVTLKIDYNDNAPCDLTADVYLGRYASEADALAANAECITEKIWGSDAPGYNAAYCSESNERYPSADVATMPCFTVVYKRDGKEIYDSYFGVFVSSTSPFDMLDFALREGDSTITTNKFYANSNWYGESEEDYQTSWIYSASAAKEDIERLANAAVLMRFAENNSDTEGVTVRVFDGEEEITSNIWDNGTAEGITYDFQSEEIPHQIRAVLTKGEKTVTLDFGLRVYLAGIRLNYYSYIYAQEDDTRTDVSNGCNSEKTVYTQKLVPGYSATGTYYLNLQLYNGDPSVKEPWANNGIASVKYAALGSYTTAEAVQAQPDIKDKLFESATTRMDTGYAADFSKGAVTFTVLDVKNDLHHLTIQLEETVKTPTLPSANNALRVYGVKDCSSYILQSTDDSYWSRGYQTLFILDNEGNPVTEEQIIPLFNSHEQARIYLGLDKTSGIPQVSGVSQIPFESGKARQYSAASEDEKHLANYFVTFLTPQDGKKLFVNAVSNSEHKDPNDIPLREVKMNSETSYHDIFIANTGTETLGSLSVEMDPSPLIHLDEYWTIGDRTRQLAAFTTVSGNRYEDGVSYRGELPNVAKIRLLPTLDEESGRPQTGIVDTIMTITSDGGTEKVHLTGLSGKLSIVTDTVMPGVKYVPYSSVIQTNALLGSGSVKFELTGGEMPAGVTLRPTGEVYGVPLETGTFTFKARAYFEGYLDDATEEQEYTLIIEENTDDNVFNATDADYTITDFVGNLVSGTESSFVVERIQDEIFLSLGEYDTFVAFYVDGIQQTEGQDYTSEEGSTKITVYAKTLEKTNDKKSHTLAAEFREGDKENGILKRAAHNYTVDIKSSSNNNNNNGNHNNNNNNNNNNNSNNNNNNSNNNNNGNNSNSNNNNNPSGGNGNTTGDTGTPSNDTGNTTQPLPTPFLDVAATDWFVEEVLWVLENGYMIGESPTSFAPNKPIQQATLVQVLARMAGIDLKKFENEQDDTIADKWYKPAAIWAKRSGALPDGTQFQGEVTINRDQMSIMLTKHLRTLGIDTTAPANRIAFADEAQMSQAGGDAFQFLYSVGIFKGVGDMQMDPDGLTTRAQLAALIHRVTDYAKSQKG